ncbi:LuxR family transcriptional regulator [Amycolatopsis mongoliensis]|uniref:LuxR family transcriptional regulator n=1 Tax=Amycolatopsis mongoliensis TaxID=715475 RepID=A0A9Y2NA36_9PSEU|nr:LuxR family transcriptional regulator [Amycolatopsis sp. 4-36]WIX98200.1 LuxR family transcriptional regulator [Amycolatopsis sp. 4-36]
MGRRTELDALVEEEAVGSTLVRGLPGSGKTALLREARRVLAGRAAPVLDVPFPADGPAWDLFGFRAVLRAVREQYELFDADPRLPDSLDDVSRTCTEEGYADPWARFCLLHTMSTLFTRLSTTAPVTVLLDDLDRLPEPVLAAAPMHRAGHAVIASCRLPPADTVDSLGGAFPRTIELGPLPPDKTADLLRRVAKVPVTPAAEQSVRESLGPWWGNPGAVIATVIDLRDRGRLETADGLARLRDPELPVALPAGHPALAELARFGDVGKQVVLLASGPDGLSVDDVPFVAGGGHRAEAAGRAVDALVRDGVLECGPAGTLRCRVPGIGAAVAQEAGDQARARLHRGIAERLLEDGDARGSHGDTLARHVASAGRELPRRAEFARVLRDAECVLAADSPARARHLYAAWWHAGPGADRAARQTEMVRHLVRVADYPAMAAFVAEASDDVEGATMTELAAGAVLAAVHLGRPVPGDVREELGRGDAARVLLDLADRWFAGDRVEPADVSACFVPVWQQDGFVAPEPGPRTWRGRRSGTLLADACAVRDLAPVLGVVLGGDYRVPASGPLSAYHRARTGYAEGRWAEALAAVAELEALDTVDGLVREHARLLAAEMCGWQGDGQRAAGWLATVPEAGYFPLLRAWVEAGLHHHAREDEEAFEAGRRAFLAHPFSRDEIGASRLLCRLAWLAGRIEDTGGRRTVVDVAETYHEVRNSPRSFGVLALVRGLAGGDETQIHTAERLVRRRGGHELVLLGESAARLSESPRGWLREAAEHTRPGCAARPAGNAREVVNSGVRVAVGRPESDVLSATEHEILELIRTGQTNRQIARVIRMSEKTVEKHLSRLFVKAGCRTRYGLATSGLGRHHDAIGA